MYPGRFRMMWLLTVKLCIMVAGDADCQSVQTYHTSAIECRRIGRAYVEWLEENTDDPAITAYKCEQMRDA